MCESMNDTNRIPVTYKNGKSEKELVKYDRLWEVAFWGFDTRIGAITNDSTTFYEIQSQFEKGSPEYEELDKRLKLFRYFQGNEIDRAKNGSKPKKLPKSFNTFQKINDNDSTDEMERKNFENKLIIEKRPAFMKFLYPKYSQKYKEFKDDFELYCYIVFGKEFSSLTPEDRVTQKYSELAEYYNKKNPLLETNGVMNRLSRYLEGELKHIKTKNTEIDTRVIFDKLYNNNIPLDNTLLDKMQVAKNEYDDFKKTKQLKTSEFSTYEQYYKYLRNKCLQEISSNIQELANLSVYICYNLSSKGKKDFCWDVFGGGIVENLKEKHPTAHIPSKCDMGEIEYLGGNYTAMEYNYATEELEGLYDFDESLFILEDDEGWDVDI